MKNKNLIIGFGTHQDPSSVQNFFRSAREIYSPETTDLAIITNSIEDIDDILRETQAFAISTVNTWSPRTTKISKLLNRILIHSTRILIRILPLPEWRLAHMTFLETFHHPQLARWFAYARVLRTVSGYSNIILSDIRDVIFQAPFFDLVKPGAVQLFEDGEHFQLPSYNGRWYISAFGQRSFEAVKDKTPICIGLIAGSAQEVTALVHEFANKIAIAPFGKIEQAIFNRLVLENDLRTPHKIMPNYSFGVATLAGAEVHHATRLQDGRIVDSRNGKPFPIVHMYDRYPDYHKACTARIASLSMA